MSGRVHHISVKPMGGGTPEPSIIPTAVVDEKDEQSSAKVMKKKS